MASEPCRRARRVSGAPQGVVAWIDHDQHDTLLLLNADRFTAQEEEAITEALRQGSYSAREVIDAFVRRG
ncbi:hypothetical protein [Streptomyces sp. H27-H5]|uniref:hypothetical protein n=1 Tax=Streptomyces sp. H27-H5 TaxID=2996460 RepID=UPI00226E5DAD|nr:hypothetical protein [Streptomyces sp. H27-H5]MCY0957651.1 hypothetical protein [Streptomyces sp. H27-H5]